jgi:hypothetical protein
MDMIGMLRRPARRAAALFLAVASAGSVSSRATRAEESPPPPGAPRTRLEPIQWPADGMITAKGAAMLRVERRLFAQELRTLKQYIPDNMRGAVSKQWGPWKTMISESHAIDHVPEMTPEEIEGIVAEMEEGALDTVQDNVERFWAALARRVPVFAEGYRHYRAGAYDKAIEAVKVLTKEDVLHCFQVYQYDTLPPYCYCAVNFFEGVCHGLNGSLHDAHVRYQVIFRAKLARSMTFSLASRVRAADLYERSQREHFAIPIYQDLVERYADMLCDAELLRIHVKFRRMMSESRFREAVRLARDVGRLMDWEAMSADTQGRQEALVERMRTIINSLEGDGRAHLQINWEMDGGADSAGLQEGRAPEKFDFKKDVAAVGSDDWGRLRPRERQELIEAFMETFADEYRPMLEAYYRQMSQAETKRE